MHIGGDIPCLEELLSHCKSEKEKANLFTDKDFYYATPAYFAVTEGKHKMADYLLQKMNKQQKTELFEAALFDRRLCIEELLKQDTKEHFETVEL